MRLHIATNEKIINRCISNFEEVHPGENKWIVLWGESTKDYVDDRKEVVKCKYNTTTFWRAVGHVKSYDKIIVHFLTQESAKFVCKITHPCIYWIEWGFDLYNILLQHKGYQLYSDSRLQKKYSAHNKLGLFFPIYKTVSLSRLQKLYYKAALKMKFFVPDSMYDEYPLLLEYYPALKNLQYKEFFYYPIDEVLGSNYEQQYCEGQNIIIGNSASLSGNHFEVLDLLKRIGIGNRNIIVPLSYGNKKYGDDVEDYGRLCFDAKFIGLREYISLDKYNEILKSGSYFIYNNYRQEAVGNILVALYLGGKVFLNTKNPLLKFYKSIGLKIFDFSELCGNDGYTSLSKEDIEHNRKILVNYYSRERQLNLIRDNM